MTDRPREYCGVLGVHGYPQAAEVAYLGLYALQHRGQEGAGIAASDGDRIRSYRGLGLVSDVFSGRQLEDLEGHLAIGHNRYSTTGITVAANNQPLVVRWREGVVAIAHNGNLVNVRELREELESSGSIFQTTTDSEVVVHLMARSRSPSVEESVADALRHVKGAYSLVILTEQVLMAARDPHGFRPLSLGRLRSGNDGHAHVVASETCAFDIVGAEFVREVEPGELVTIDARGVRSAFPFSSAPRRQCIFELVYFSRPDSVTFGRSVHQVRVNLGRELARTAPADADLVIAVPDSSNAAALGFSRESGLPFDLGLIRNHYIGRTFIQPSQDIRNLEARIKHNAVKEVLAGSRVVVVDDSIVRGTTSGMIVEMLRRAGCREVHLRISCPPWRFPCCYGIDTPTREELIASSCTLEQIREKLEVDSLGFQETEGLLRSCDGTRDEFCLACFSGDYPVAPPQPGWKHCLELDSSG
jgi:amidophosphoribosyltransferase